MLLMTLAWLGLFIVVMYGFKTVSTDVTNLYSSRDAIWRELHLLQQTSKRRDSEYRQRLHKLQRKVNGDRKSVV